MWKMYDSWDDYKTRFKKYNCVAGIGNVDDEEPEYTATTSYQMIQTLRNLTEYDIKELGKKNYEEILCNYVGFIYNYDCFVGNYDDAGERIDG